MVENRLVPWRRRGAAPAVQSPFESFFGPGAFGSLQDEVNRLFEDFWGTAPATAEEAGRPVVLRPRVDLSETEAAFEISAEMPGLKEDEIEVSVTDDVLSLKGEHKAESEKKGEHYHVRERSYGSFRRSFRLPANADAEKVSAKFENGVLHLTVPKTAEAKAKSRKIAIEKT
jgi:HSP20 family protein